LLAPIAFATAKTRSSTRIGQVPVRPNASLADIAGYDPKWSRSLRAPPPPHESSSLR
jgi:hypothetical protein